MFTLELDPTQAPDTVCVEDEPALEIAIPQVFVQPELVALQRGKLPHVDALALRIAHRSLASPDEPLGLEYQELVTEFQPLFTWATACWDYLLTTEGCRFLPRGNEQKYGARGDYRAMTDRDFSRLVHRIFRGCVVGFAQAPEAMSLSQWLREQFWPLIRAAYRRLENPPDPRQRTLTAYSYLRCIA